MSQRIKSETGRGKKKSLYGFYLRIGKLFQAERGRTELEKISCRMRQNNTGETIIFGEEAMWDIVGNKNNRVCKRQ